jgi:hypothetical protein
MIPAALAPYRAYLRFLLARVASTTAPQTLIPASSSNRPVSKRRR